MQTDVSNGRGGRGSFHEQGRGRGHAQFCGEHRNSRAIYSAAIAKKGAEGS